MTETEFHKNISGGKTLLRVAPPLESDFWYGYYRGLCRMFYGARFGTPEEHESWLECLYPEDISRLMRQAGYTTGFTGTPIAEAIDTVNKALAEQSVLKTADCGDLD